METRNLDHLTLTLAAARSRRETLRLFGAAMLGVGGVRLIAADTAAKRGKPRKRSRKPQRAVPDLVGQVVDVAITAIFVAQTAEPGHDALVVEFVNNGAVTASGFRIGVTAYSADGVDRPETLSLPITLGPGQRGSERFRLGCRWLNGATVTARTSPSPVPGEPDSATRDNVATARFGAAICVVDTEGTTLPGDWH